MKKSLLMVTLLVAPAVMFSQQWNSNLKVAIQNANEQNKKVLLYFSVPEACDACEALEQTVFKTDAFKKYAHENFILARADFSGEINPEEKAENLLIVEKYNKDGFFPLVVIMDQNAKVLGKTGVYNNEDTETYIKLLQTISQD